VHVINVVLINLSIITASENLQPKGVMGAIFVDAFRQKVNYDVCLADVHQHIIFEDYIASSGPSGHVISVHFLENPKTDTKILDVIAHELRLDIEPYLEVTAAMLLCRLCVARWNHEVIHDEWPRANMPSILVRWHQVFALLIEYILEAAKVRKSIRRCLDVARCFILVKLPERLKLICWLDAERVDHNDLPFGQSGRTYDL
jgi:hypothetical protein